MHLNWNPLDWEVKEKTNLYPMTWVGVVTSTREEVGQGATLLWGNSEVIKVGWRDFGRNLEPAHFDKLQLLVLVLRCYCWVIYIFRAEVLTQKKYLNFCCNMIWWWRWGGGRGELWQQFVKWSWLRRCVWGAASPRGRSFLSAWRGKAKRLGFLLPYSASQCGKDKR